MPYNFPEGMFATNDLPVHHITSNACENPFPTPAWGVAPGSYGKRVFFGFELWTCSSALQVGNT